MKPCPDRPEARDHGHRLRDSRVSPEVIFDASPGELLVVRNVANLVPAYEAAGDSQHGTSAALEFGVQALRVKHIVVLGHALCGGIRAFADEQEPLSPGDFIGRWMSQIAPAAESLGARDQADGESYLRRLEFASVELSLRNLMTFPCVRSWWSAASWPCTARISVSPPGACWCAIRRPASSSRWRRPGTAGGPCSAAPARTLIPRHRENDPSCGAQARAAVERFKMRMRPHLCIGARRAIASDHTPVR